MSERQLQLRVGLFTMLALGALGVMIFTFGDLKKMWEPRYKVVIHFPSAPGVHQATPVRRNGIAIGEVADVIFDEKRGGVIVIAEIKSQYKLSIDAKPKLVASLLGDASIEFEPGSGKHFLASGARIEGETPSGPMEVVERLEGRMSQTLDAFHSTSREWELVGKNLNDLLQHNQQGLNKAIDQAAISMQRFAETMTTANKTLLTANEILGDKQNQENLKQTLAALPKLARETQDAIGAVKLAVLAADDNLKNLKAVTGPLAQRSNSIVTRLDGTLANLQSLSKEMNAFAQLMAKRDGTLHKLASDPQLYNNLNRSAASLAVLLRNMEPVLRDARIFSDKIARHPELLGVSGALSGSSGIKDAPPINSQGQPRRAAWETPRGRTRQ